MGIKGRLRFHQILFLILILFLPVQLGRHFWPSWSYVWGFRVDYLSPTVYLTDLLVIGILSFWALGKLKPLNFKPLKLRRFLFPISAFLFLLASSFLAQNSGAAFYKFLKIIEFAFLGWYIAEAGIKLSAFTKCLSLAAIYSSLIALAQFFKQSSLGGIFWWLGERTFAVSTPGIAKAVVDGKLVMRPYATFPHPNVLAGFLLISLVLIHRLQGHPDVTSGRPPGRNFDLAQPRMNPPVADPAPVRGEDSISRGGSKEKKGRVLFWLAIILGTVAIGLSFSRSAWLVALLVAAWSFENWRKKKSLLLLISLIAVIGFFLFFKLPFSTDEAFSQRLQLIKVAFSMIRSLPVAGVGLNNFIVRLSDFWQQSGGLFLLQPVHNIFLLAAAETGLVGGVIFVWLLTLTYKRLLVANNRLLIITLTSILFLGLFDHYWLTLQQAQLLFTAVLGLSWHKGKTPSVLQ